MKGGNYHEIQKAHTACCIIRTDDRAVHNIFGQDTPVQRKRIVHVHAGDTSSHFPRDLTGHTDEAEHLQVLQPHRAASRSGQVLLSLQFTGAYRHNRQNRKDTLVQQCIL